MLHLIYPQPDFLETFRQGLTEIRVQPTPYDLRSVQQAISFMDSDFEGYWDYLAKSESQDQPEGYVPSTTLWLMNGNKFVGLYDIRHYLTPALEKQGGHIGYQIIPSERGQGYVRDGLKLVLEWCHAHLNLDAVLLCCNQKNTASYRAMTSVMREMGGYERPVIEIDNQLECSVWIKTKK